MTSFVTGSWYLWTPFTYFSHSPTPSPPSGNHSSVLQTYKLGFLSCCCCLLFRPCRSLLWPWDLRSSLGHVGSLVATFGIFFLFFNCVMWHLVSWPRIEPGPLQWDLGLLITGPPGKSLMVHKVFVFLWLVSFNIMPSVQFSSFQSLSCVWLFVTPWTTARQASLSITNSQSLPKLMSIE